MVHEVALKPVPVQDPRFTLPFLPGLEVAPLGISDALRLVPGWGVFNLGTEVNKIIFTLQNKKG